MMFIDPTFYNIIQTTSFDPALFASSPAVLTYPFGMRTPILGPGTVDYFIRIVVPPAGTPFQLGDSHHDPNSINNDAFPRPYRGDVHLLATLDSGRFGAGDDYGQLDSLTRLMATLLHETQHYWLSDTQLHNIVWVDAASRIARQSPTSDQFAAAFNTPAFDLPEFQLQGEQGGKHWSIYANGVGGVMYTGGFEDTGPLAENPAFDVFQLFSPVGFEFNAIWLPPDVETSAMEPLEGLIPSKNGYALIDKFIMGWIDGSTVNAARADTGFFLIRPQWVQGPGYQVGLVIRVVPFTSDGPDSTIFFGFHQRFDVVRVVQKGDLDFDSGPVSIADFPQLAPSGGSVVFRVLCSPGVGLVFQVRPLVGAADEMRWVQVRDALDNSSTPGWESNPDAWRTIATVTPSALGFRCSFGYGGRAFRPTSDGNVGGVVATCSGLAMGADTVTFVSAFPEANPYTPISLTLRNSVGSRPLQNAFDFVIPLTTVGVLDDANAGVFRTGSEFEGGLPFAVAGAVRLDRTGLVPWTSLTSVDEIIGRRQDFDMVATEGMLSSSLQQYRRRFSSLRLIFVLEANSLSDITVYRLHVADWIRMQFEEFMGRAFGGAVTVITEVFSNDFPSTVGA